MIKPGRDVGILNMALSSFLFAGNARLEACAIQDSAHVLLGDSGTHVGKIQAALEAIDGLFISGDEWQSKRYGSSTSAAVLQYKSTRNIINRSYQSKADAIVGRMTIATLDADMAAIERADDPSTTNLPSSFRCHRCGIIDTPSILALNGQRGLVEKLESLALRHQSSFSENDQSVTAPTAEPGQSLPNLSVGIGDSWAVQDDLQHIMIPEGGRRQIAADTKGQKSFLAVPENVSVNTSLFNFAFVKKDGLGFSRIDIPANAGKFTIELAGLLPRTMPIALRATSELFVFDKKRDVTLAVKAKIARAVKFVLPTDARLNKSIITSQEIKDKFGFVKAFYMKKCNIDLTGGDVEEIKVDQDLGDEFDSTAAVARQSLPNDDFTNKAIGKRSRLFENAAERNLSRTSFVVYVMWKLKNSNPMLVAVTNGQRMFMQDTGKDLAKWTLALAHETGHALGVPGNPHPDPPGFLMTKDIEGVGNLMSLLATEMVNPQNLFQR